ncbi:MAG: phosphonate C-P lyase system protein PhnH [Hyphomicrobiaceae bacterium]
MSARLPLAPAPAVPGPGFSAPVLDAQRTFRAVMTALAEPGTVHEIAAGGPQCPELSPAMTAIALTLADYETRLWLQVGPDSEAARYLRFHTGAPIVAAEHDAGFAFVTRPLAMPRLAAFAQGNLDYPDASTTIVIDVERIDTTQGFTLSGPGIAGRRRLGVSPLPTTFAADIAANRAAFPCGVDLIFCAGHRIAALPRSTRVAAADGGR